MAKANLDPDESDALKVQAGIEGKTVVEAAHYVVVHGTPAQRAVASKVASKLVQLTRMGVNFDLKIGHVGDMVPRALLCGRGMTHYKFHPNNASMTVWLNGADVEGKVGVGMDVVLHQLVHAAVGAGSAVGSALGFQIPGKRGIYDVATVARLFDLPPEAERDLAAVMAVETSVPDDNVFTLGPLANATGLPLARQSGKFEICTHHPSFYTSSERLGGSHYPAVRTDGKAGSADQLRALQTSPEREDYDNFKNEATGQKSSSTGNEAVAREPVRRG